jgi:hypothetical protein
MNATIISLGGRAPQLGEKRRRLAENLVGAFEFEFSR